MAVSNYTVRKIFRTLLFQEINSENIKGINNEGQEIIINRNNVYKENLKKDDSFINSECQLIEWLFPVNDVPNSNDESGGTGFYQINIYENKGKGTNLSDTVAYTIANAFGEGVTYTMDNVAVTVDYTNIEQSFENEDKWVTPIRIEYRKQSII